MPPGIPNFYGGTPEYMPPETVSCLVELMYNSICKQDSQVKVGADWWSWGVLLYKAAYNQHPFCRDCSHLVLQGKENTGERKFGWIRRNVLREQDAFSLPHHNVPFSQQGVEYPLSSHLYGVVHQNYWARLSQGFNAIKAALSVNSEDRIITNNDGVNAYLNATPHDTKRPFTHTGVVYDREHGYWLTKVHRESIPGHVYTHKHGDAANEMQREGRTDMLCLWRTVWERFWG